MQPRLLLLALLAACAGTAAPSREQAYLCDGGRMAVVTFAGEVARVRLANDEFELRHAKAASGARYTGPRGNLHTKDDEALLMVDGRELGPCQEVKPQS